MSFLAISQSVSPHQLPQVKVCVVACNTGKYIILCIQILVQSVSFSSFCTYLPSCVHHQSS